MRYYTLAAASIIVLVLGFILPSPVVAQMTNVFHEDFSTKEYIQEGFTCEIDTVAGQVSLKDFEMALAAGYITSGSAYDVVVSGDYAYVADHFGGLLVIDISNLGSLHEEGSYNTSGTADAIDISGDHVFIADGASGLQIIDVSDPSSPVPAGNYNPASSVDDVVVDGDYAYLATNSGVMIIDISNVAIPSYLGTCSTPAAVLGVDCDGYYVYAAGYTAGVHVIDVSSPTSPSILGTYNTPGNAVDVAAAGDVLYVADQSGGLQIVDISVPSSPSLLGSFSTSASAYGLCSYLNCVYIAIGGDGLVVVDVSNPASPSMADGLDLYLSRNVTINGHYAFVADHEGLKAVNISDAAPLVTGDDVSLNGTFGDIIVRGSYAYYDGEDAFTILDVGDPDNISVTGTLSTLSGENRFDIAGDYAFVAADDGMRVIDISDPAAPSLVTTYTLVSGVLEDICVAGNYAFFADADYGLNSADISDPSNPLKGPKIELYSTYGHVNSVVPSGDYLFVGAALYMVVVDISNPSSFSVVGSYLSNRNITNITINGDYAYLSESGSPGGIKKIDISDPTLPVFVWDMTADWAEEFLIDGYDAFALCADGAVHYDISGYYADSIDVYDYYNSSYTGALAGGYLFLKDGFTFRSVQYRQRELSSPGNFISELIYDIGLNPYGNLILQAKIVPQCDSDYYWGINGGGGFEPVEAGEWYDFPGLGEYAYYRGWMEMRWDGSDTYCSSVDVKFLFDAATIDSIVDVPGDNGGWGRIYFSRSGLDRVGANAIDEYYLWRRVDDPLLLSRINEDGVKSGSTNLTAAGANPGYIDLNRPEALDLLGAVSLDGRIFVEGGRDIIGSSDGMPPGIWEIAGNAPAHYQDQYVYLVPMLGDSAATIPYNVFCVTTEKSAGGWYYAWPDSGYSVDNIVPTAPTGFSLFYNTGSGNELNWDICPDNDFMYFNVYRSTEADFVPSGADLVHATIDISWLDTVENGHLYFYKISAIDISGNESIFSAPGVVTGDDTSPMPSVVALHQNVPNPFNPVTRIMFDLPEPSSVRLAVYNVKGELVRTLVRSKMPAGTQDISWDGIDDKGDRVSSGVYFCRLVTSGYSISRKMVLMR